jgi:small subunit ribosomal protein S6
VRSGKQKQDGVKTLNKYAALFIFPTSLEEEQLDKAVDRACAEIEKLGGKIDGRRILGRRHFARPMKKMEAGCYVRVVFSADAGVISPVLARYKLNEDVFRVQIVRAEEEVPEEAAKEKAEADAAATAKGE